MQQWSFGGGLGLKYIIIVFNFTSFVKVHIDIHEYAN